MSFKEYQISVNGCDDRTTVTLPLDEREVAFMEALANRINAASYEQCQPTMYVEPA